MTLEKRRIPVQTIAGPGVSGMEYDPPLFHYDLEADEVQDFLLDPATFVAERLDMTAEQRALQPPDRRCTVIVSDLIWSDSGWHRLRTLRSGEAGVSGLPVPSCVYDDGDVMVIHRHYRGPHGHLPGPDDDKD
jgi:hypothetical protein